VAAGASERLEILTHSMRKSPCRDLNDELRPSSGRELFPRQRAFEVRHQSTNRSKLW
jgi:hypothetical protein